MSTHVLIAMKNGDNYDTIYCHGDGYPSYVGKQLQQFYPTQEKVAELIELGDISGINRDGTVIAYCRDRGEDREDTKARSYPGTSLNIQGCASYVYLFEDGAWTCRRDRKRVPLAQAIKEDSE